MRYVYIGLVVFATAIVLLFKVQNLSVVTVSLLGMSVTVPVFLLVIGIYLLGMLTGSSLLALVRGWIRNARGDAA